MKLQPHVTQRAWALYRKEALICFALDLVVMLIYAAVMHFGGALQKEPRCWLVIPVYGMVACLAHYRIALLSLVEQWRKLTVSDTVIISQLEEDVSASGRRRSILTEFAPKGTGLARTAFLCTDSSGKKIRLRRVTVSRNLQLLGNARFRDGSVKRRVTYGKLTHIILTWDDNDAMALELNRAFEGLQ